MHSGSVFPHLFSFPVTFMVYFSPTQVTFVSNPEENPIWYPTEKAKAANNNANANVSKNLTNLPKVSQNFSMAPSFDWCQFFPLSPFLFMIRSYLRKKPMYYYSNIHANEWAGLNFLIKLIAYDFQEWQPVEWKRLNGKIFLVLEAGCSNLCRLTTG